MTLPAIGSIVFHIAPHPDHPWDRVPVFARVKSHHVTKAGTFAKVEELTTRNDPNDTAMTFRRPSVFLGPHYEARTVASPGNTMAAGRTWKIRVPATPPSRHNDVVVRYTQLQGKTRWVSGRVKADGTEWWFQWTPQIRVPHKRKRQYPNYSSGRVKKITVLKALRSLPENATRSILQKSMMRGRHHGYPNNAFANF